MDWCSVSHRPVYQFNRVTQFLNFVARVGFYLQTGHYFDDFIQVENECNAIAAKKYLQSLCDSCGWVFGPR